MRGVVFEGPEDLAACAKFLQEVGAILDQESERLHGYEHANDGANTGNDGPLALPRRR